MSVRANLAQKVNKELERLDALAAEVEKANAACFIHLRGIAKEMVRTRRKMEGDAKDLLFTRQLPFITAGNLISFVADVIDEKPPEIRDGMIDVIPPEIKEHLDQLESEALGLIDIMGTSCMRRVIRAHIEGKELDDIVKIAKGCAPYLFRLDPAMLSISKITF